MKLKAYLLTAIAVVASLLNFNATAWTSSKYHIDYMNVAREHGLLKVDMNVNPAQYRMGTDKQMHIVPVVKSLTTNDSIILPAIVVAGRNSYYNTERAGNLNGTLLRSGKGKTFNYAATAEWQPWMEYSELELQSGVTGCCGKPENEYLNRKVAIIDFRPTPFEPNFVYMPSTDEGPKFRKIEGKAYVSFPVNRTEIYPDYMINPQELRKITNSIDTVRNDPDATVKSITLTGYASPEGPYANNIRLAAGRTEAVKEYVRKQYTFPAKVFKTHSVPEDWAGLRDSVAVSILPDRMEILDFIDNDNVPIERKNDVLREKFPTSYAFLLKHVYPWLRHTNYLIDYEIREYTDINEILKVYKENPSKLSLNEFYRAANTYPVGSKEYNEVMETALVYNKDNAVANINAANAAMAEGDYKRARILLNRVKAQPEGIYGIAVLDALEGKYDAAEAGFKAASKAGIHQANEALQQIETLKQRLEHIEYIDEN
ncbi:MAG: hypothetical protein NC548_50065 [Lachnospiraceae bacterium]|nr:hypothetical protein [Prevotella sp.]MCM1075696.1 hypothetical protein [Ruminococcus sp.]MCM1222638.1 hypothetical protein [Lachnospiraceae bacterium]